MQLVKHCNTLVEQGKIHGKLYGKQWIYCAKQDDLPAPSRDEIIQMDCEIEKSKQQILKLNEEIKSMQSELSLLESTFTDDVLYSKLRDLEDSVSKLQTKVTQLKEGTIKVSLDEKTKVEKELNSVKEMCKKRTLLFL